jgi:hypothetical protein
MSKSYPTRQRFYGSDDFFDSALIKSNVLITAVNLMGSTIFMAKREGMFTFTEGMIRKTFSIREAPTVLDLHLIPGYRLILNNVLFPAARKKNRRLNL